MEITFMKYIFLLLTVCLISCDRKGKCNVEKISQSVFDSIYVKGDFVMANQKHEIDTLKIINYYDEFETSYNLGIMVHQECGHFIDYSYKFKEETINLGIEKNEKELIFKAESLHMVNEQRCDKNSNFENKPLIVDGKYCKSNIFKTIVIKNFKIELILTKNGDKWFFILIHAESFL